MAGDAFILLLQMTLLPYIMVSLIAGLGGLSLHEAAVLGRNCGLLILVLWAIGLLMVLLVPLAFPNWETASFFSTSLIEQKPAFNILGLYIPSNLFYSLSNNVVPAVVVFSLALGIALIGLKEKEVLLQSLALLTDGLGGITNFLIKLAPSGVFAIIASATGTMRFAEFVNHWIDLKEKDGTIKALYDYWILGRNAVEHQPRWSVMRNVLHLAD